MLWGGVGGRGCSHAEEETNKVSFDAGHFSHAERWCKSVSTSLKGGGGTTDVTLSLGGGGGAQKVLDEQFPILYPAHLIEVVKPVRREGWCIAM